jgi:hypothetical protein
MISERGEKNETGWYTMTKLTHYRSSSVKKNLFVHLQYLNDQSGVML